MQELGASNENAPPVWAIFGDLMSGLVGVFVLIVLIDRVNSALFISLANDGGGNFWLRFLQRRELEHRNRRLNLIDRRRTGFDDLYFLLARLLT